MARVIALLLYVRVQDPKRILCRIWYTYGGPVPHPPPPLLSCWTIDAVLIVAPVSDLGLVADLGAIHNKPSYT